MRLYALLYAFSCKELISCLAAGASFFLPHLFGLFVRVCVCVLGSFCMQCRCVFVLGCRFIRGLVVCSCVSLCVCLRVCACISASSCLRLSCVHICVRARAVSRDLSSNHHDAIPCVVPSQYIFVLGGRFIRSQGW